MIKQQQQQAPPTQTLPLIPRPSLSQAASSSLKSFGANMVHTSNRYSPATEIPTSGGKHRSLLTSAMKRPLYSNFPYPTPFTQSMAASDHHSISTTTPALNNMDANALLLSMYTRIINRQLSTSNDTKPPLSPPSAAADDSNSPPPPRNHHHDSAAAFPLDLSFGKSESAESAGRTSQSPVHDDEDNENQPDSVSPTATVASKSGAFSTPGSPLLGTFTGNPLFSDPKVFSQLAYLSAAVAASKLNKFKTGPSSP